VFTCFFPSLCGSQDYALLMGAIAFFVVLSIVMYVTRKIDWYARDAG
jgi:inner membrane protein involved in colicin E2 resistance